MTLYHGGKKRMGKELSEIIYEQSDSLDPTENRRLIPPQLRADFFDEKC